MRIRYYCHAGQETGYGRAATELALALALVEAGVDLQIVPLNPSLSLPFGGKAAPLAEHTWADDDTDPYPPDVAIVHTLPVDCVRFAREHLTEGRPRLEHGGPVVIAYTTWEGVDAPAEVVESLFETFDQVWVPSRPTRDALQESASVMTDCVCRVLPHTFTPPKMTYTAKSLEPVSRDRPFTFYWIGAWSVRKNPHGLIRAFCHAFRPDDPVELLLHSPGTSMEAFAMALAATGLEQHEQPKIVLSNKHTTDDGIWNLHNGADCFVTATRGESWNLPAFEAMLAKRNIITPLGTGADDFLWSNGDLEWKDPPLTSAARVSVIHQPAFVDVEMIRASSGALALQCVGVQGMTSRTLWGDPDLPHLADAMREAFDLSRRDLKVRYDVESKFGHKAVAAMAINFMKEALDER